MDLRPTTIPGCYLVGPEKHEDARGWLTKTYRRDVFEALGAGRRFEEHFHTFSRTGVLRGLHVQTPPAATGKLVTCLSGLVLDAALDLRRGSRSFGRHLLVELEGDAGAGIYLPPGVAHGFYVLAGPALLTYAMTSAYDPACDDGVLWSSAGIPWPDSGPLVSPRDAALPALADYPTPFELDDREAEE
jgi:dTDP-4-dehydrorhamnose 3,5-epimerase